MQDRDNSRESRAIARGVIGGTITFWCIMIWWFGWLEALLLFGAITVCALGAALVAAIEAGGGHE